MGVSRYIRIVGAVPFSSLLSFPNVPFPTLNQTCTLQTSSQSLPASVPSHPSAVVPRTCIVYFFFIPPTRSSSLSFFHQSLHIFRVFPSLSERFMLLCAYFYTILEHLFEPARPGRTKDIPSKSLSPSPRPRAETRNIGWSPGARGSKKPFPSSHIFSLISSAGLNVQFIIVPPSCPNRRPPAPKPPRACTPRLRATHLLSHPFPTKVARRRHPSPRPVTMAPICPLFL